MICGRLITEWPHSLPFPVSIVFAMWLFLFPCFLNIGCTCALLWTIEYVGNDVEPRSQKVFHASVLSCEQAHTCLARLLVTSCSYCPNRHLANHQTWERGHSRPVSLQPAGPFDCRHMHSRDYSVSPSTAELPSWHVDSWAVIRGSYFKSLCLVLQQ